MPRFGRPDPTEYDSYYTRYTDLVEPDVTDILAHLKVQGLVMLTLLRRLEDEAAAYRYEPGKWSIKEVVGHLIDTDRVFAYRSLAIARGQGEGLPDMDPDSWGTATNADSRPLAALWREQHVARTDHVYLWKSLDDEGITRAGTAGGAKLSVRAIPWILAGHERHHMNVLQDRYGLQF